MAAVELSPPEVSVPWPSSLARRASFAREATSTTYTVAARRRRAGPSPTPLGGSLGSDLFDFSVPEPITLVMKNIPARSTWPDVLDAIDMFGFRGTFEFFHLPTKADGNRCKGYAFVSFDDRAVARAFFFAVDGARFRTSSDKQVSIEVSSEHRSLSKISRRSRTIHESRFGPVVVNSHAHAAEQSKAMAICRSARVLSF